MDKKTIAVIVAAASIYFWFQPFSSFGYFYQSGQHWGGLAYGLMVLPILFAIFFWINQKQLSLIFSILALLLSCNFLMKVGTSVGWGLLGLLICSGISVYIAIRMKEAPGSESQH